MKSSPRKLFFHSFSSCGRADGSRKHPSLTPWSRHFPHLWDPVHPGRPPWPYGARAEPVAGCDREEPPPLNPRRFVPIAAPFPTESTPSQPNRDHGAALPRAGFRHPSAPTRPVENLREWTQKRGPGPWPPPAADFPLASVQFGIRRSPVLGALHWRRRIRFPNPRSRSIDPLKPQPPSEVHPQPPESLTR